MYNLQPQHLSHAPYQLTTTTTVPLLPTTTSATTITTPTTLAPTTTPNTDTQSKIGAKFISLSQCHIQINNDPIRQSALILEFMGKYVGK